MIDYHSADKPWIGVDLDGTLSEHYWPTKGDFHPLIIGDPIMPMIRLVKTLLEQGHTVKVFTARVGVRGSSPNNVGVKLAEIKRVIYEWTLEHIGTGLEATCSKDYNMVMLYDDRALNVAHNKGVVCSCLDKAS
jgi:hypothetical protein